MESAEAPLASDVLYGYDELGRLKSVSVQKQLKSDPALAAVANDRYDAVGNVVETTAAKPTIVYGYDAAGILERVSLPNGVVSDYEYDALDRLDLLTVRRDSGHTPSRTSWAARQIRGAASGLRLQSSRWHRRSADQPLSMCAS